MRTGLIIVVAAAAVVAGCSSGGPQVLPSTSHSSTSHPSASKTAPVSIDQRLRTALLSAGALGRAGLEVNNAGSEFDETENTKYTLIRGCASSLAGNRRIDGEWESSFSSSGATYAFGTQIAVHYSSGGPAAVAELEAAGTCDPQAVGYPTTEIAPPVVTGASVRCQEFEDTGETACQAVAADGAYATMVTIRGANQHLVFDAMRTLGPILQQTVAGRPPAISAPAPTTSALPPPIAGVWSLAVAKQHFESMSSTRDEEYCTSGLDRLLAGDYSNADVASIAQYLGEECASSDKSFGDNLAVGHWPTAVKSLIVTVEKALAAEEAFLTKISKVRTATSFGRSYTAGHSAFAKTDDAIEAARAALG